MIGRGLFWRVYASWYDALWDTELTGTVARRVLEEVPGDLRVVEVGAGTGLITRELAGARTVLCACEPNPHMRAHLLAKGLKVGSVTSESIEDLSLPSGDYCVVVVNVLHLVADAPGCLERLRAIAGPGGCVIAVSPTPQASVLGVARAQGLAGASMTRCLRFCTAHLLLGMLGMLAGLRPKCEALTPESLVDVVGGVQEIHLLGGVARVAAPARERGRKRPPL